MTDNERASGASTSREELDRATAARLAKLCAMPVELASLERRLKAELPPRAGDAVVPQRLRWFRPMRIAAGLLLALGIFAAAIVVMHETPAVASPAELVRLHDDAIAGRGHVIQVQSIDQARRALAEQWSAKPDLPEMPGAEVMACCLHEMGKKRMAAVTMSVNGTPITMAVADANDLRSPKSPAVERNGATWHTQSAEDVNMVSTKRAGRWVCLMGRVPTDRLIDLAQSLQF